MRLELTQPLKVLPPQSSASTNSATWTYIDRSGAKNGTRTRDPDLGKVVLYQLSLFSHCVQKIPINYYFNVLGAKNGTRTRDPDLGKVVLYQLKFIFAYLSVQDETRTHTAYLSTTPSK